MTYFIFHETESTNRDGEIQKLNTEVSRAKELDNIVQRQTFELEQFKQQLSDHLQSNHAAEENKIEIRNLQNALDSSKKELEAQRLLVNDYKVKLEDLNQQLTESKQLTNSKSSGDNFLVSHLSFHEIYVFNIFAYFQLNEKLNELIANHQNILSQKDKQLTDYQKQVETLQKVENDLTKQINEQKAKNNVSFQKLFDIQLSLNSYPKPFPCFLLFKAIWWFIYFLLPRFSLTIHTRRIQNMTTGFENEKLEIGWGITLSRKFNSQIN